MSSSGTTYASPNLVADALAADRLGSGAVIQFVLTAATPMLVVAGLVTSGLATTGVIAFPLAFLVFGVVLAVFSVGYTAMARQVPNAGALYTYVARGLGRPAGVAAALVALFSYNLLQVGLYGIAGVLASSLVEQVSGTVRPWWWFAALAWLLTAVLGVRRVDLNGRVLAVLLTAELGVVAVIDVVGFLHPASGRVQLDALHPAGLLSGAAAAVFAVVATGFVGFELAAVYSEESVTPRRTVPRATYLGLGLMTVVYAVSSLAVTVAVGPDRVVAAAEEQGVGLLFSIADPVLGARFTRGAQVLFLTSVIAGLISYHSAVARYAYVLGREGVLPRVLGRTRLSTGAPAAASVVQSAIGLAVIAVFAGAGWDPLARLFFWLGTVGGVGVLILVAATSVSVPLYFRHGTGLDSRWRTTVAPLIAAVLLTAVAVRCLTHFPDLLGVSPGNVWAVVWPGSYAVLALAGVVWALLLRRRDPAAYRGIGLGGHPDPTATGERAGAA
ncbi:amino acid transporter [Allocatelliglobosispora scoriae]|uniref:Amino acid transporter n=1 Tax=Allocatelliglobosispora scoriae TaxID=643052 RepID=A0A841BEJ6_9ACTN|nr:APC family permease [Allocatelliglobosispora scoriae]MBB5866714.1 amino acid transporter [Allocatelliglobosispora scoriae]